MGLRISGDNERIHVPRLVGRMEAPSADFSFRGMATRDGLGGVGLWSKDLKSYRRPGTSAMLAAYELGNPKPTRTLFVPAVPVRSARAARMPDDGWVIGGQTDAGTQLLRVVTSTGATQAECTPLDKIDQIVTDSDGFVWVLGSALTKYNRDLRQVWQSPGGIRDDWSTDAVNLGPAEVLAAQSDSDGNAVVLRIRDGHDTVVIPVPQVECIELVIAADGWLGIAGDIEPTMIIGTVTGEAFEERFRVRLAEDDRHSLVIDETACVGDTAYLDDGYQWSVLTLGELFDETGRGRTPEKRSFRLRERGPLLPPAGFDYLGSATFDPSGVVAVWTSKGRHYRRTGDPAVLAAYDTGSTTPTRTLHLAALPVSNANVAPMPGGDWLISGWGPDHSSVLRVLAPGGSTRTDNSEAELAGVVATDSDGYVWAAGCHLTKYGQDLSPVWESECVAEVDGDTEAINVGRGLVVAGQSRGVLDSVLIEVRVGHEADAVTTTVPNVMGFEAIVVDGDLVGILRKGTADLVVGRVRDGAFEMTFEVELQDPNGIPVVIDESSSRGDTAHLRQGSTWCELRLGDLTNPRPQDAPPPSEPTIQDLLTWGRD